MHGQVYRGVYRGGPAARGKLSGQRVSAGREALCFALLLRAAGICRAQCLLAGSENSTLRRSSGTFPFPKIWRHKLVERVAAAAAANQEAVVLLDRVPLLTNLVQAAMHAG